MSKVMTPPLCGSLMTIPAFCRCGILKSFVVVGAGLFACRVEDGAGCTIDGAGPGVCDLPRPEAGRSVAEMADELRDICCVWGTLLYWPMLYGCGGPCGICWCWRGELGAM